MTPNHIRYRGATYQRVGDIQTERADLAMPVLQAIYKDIVVGEVDPKTATDHIDDYVSRYVTEALKTSDDYYSTEWDLLRDVLREAAREELIRSTRAGVEANWGLLDEWIETEKELG